MLRDKRIDHTHHVPVGDDVHAAVGIVHAVHQLAAVVNEKLLGVAVAVGIGHVVHGENKRGLAFGQHDLLPHHFPVLFDPELVQIVQHVAALVELGQYLFKFGLFGEAGVVAAHRRFTVGEHHFGIDDQTVEEDVPYFALIGNKRLRRRLGCRRRLRGEGGRRFRGRRGRRRREKDVERAAAAPGEERCAEQRREKKKYLSFHHAIILSAAPEKVKARRFPNLGCVVLTML